MTAPIVREGSPAELAGVADAHRASVQGLLAATYSAETIAAWVDESVRMRKVR
jgi:hypothetical protein